MNVTIVANLSTEQLNHIMSLGRNNGIEFQVFVEFMTTAQESAAPTPAPAPAPVRTPITDAHIVRVSQEAGIRLADAVQYASSFGSLEEALASDHVPSNVKQVIENLL
jgi:hypothetical protein